MLSDIKLISQRYHIKNGKSKENRKNVTNGYWTENLLERLRRPVFHLGCLAMTMDRHVIAKQRSFQQAEAI